MPWLSMHGYPTHSMIQVVLINRIKPSAYASTVSGCVNVAAFSEADPVHGCSRHLTSFPSLDHIEAVSTRAHKRPQAERLEVHA
jgi:hypothetical protein